MLIVPCGHSQKSSQSAVPAWAVVAPFSVGLGGTTDWTQSHHTAGGLAPTELCLLAEASLWGNYPRSQRLVLERSITQSSSVPGTNMINGTVELPGSAFRSKRSTGEPEEISSVCLVISGIFDGYCGRGFKQ